MDIQESFKKFGKKSSVLVYAYLLRSKCLLMAGEVMRAKTALVEAEKSLEANQHKQVN